MPDAPRFCPAISCTNRCGGPQPNPFGLTAQEETDVHAAASPLVADPCASGRERQSPGNRRTHPQKPERPHSSGSNPTYVSVKFSTVRLPQSGLKVNADQRSPRALVCFKRRVACPSSSTDTDISATTYRRIKVRWPTVSRRQHCPPPGGPPTTAQSLFPRQATPNSLPGHMRPGAPLTAKRQPHPIWAAIAGQALASERKGSHPRLAWRGTTGAQPSLGSLAAWLITHTLQAQTSPATTWRPQRQGRHPRPALPGHRIGTPASGLYGPGTFQPHAGIGPLQGVWAHVGTSRKDMPWGRDPRDFASYEPNSIPAPAFSEKGPSFEGPRQQLVLRHVASRKTRSLVAAG